MDDTESVEVEEREEIVDGKRCIVRRTTKKNTHKEVMYDELLPKPVKVETRHDDTLERRSTIVFKELKLPQTTHRLDGHCRSPSGKVTSCDIHDNHDGTHTVNIIAEEPGTYTLDISANGRKVPGSPFILRIIQPPNTTKVHAYGAGMKSGILNDFDGVFHIDTENAGSGDLKVRINGPKEGFDFTMFRDHNKGYRVIKVKYNPKVSGIYTVFIYWCGEHVVGSPQEIYIAADAKDLLRWQHHPEDVRAEDNHIKRF